MGITYIFTHTSSLYLCIPFPRINNNKFSIFISISELNFEFRIVWRLTHRSTNKNYKISLIKITSAITVFIHSILWSEVSVSAPFHANNNNNLSITTTHKRKFLILLFLARRYYVFTVHCSIDWIEASRVYLETIDKRSTICRKANRKNLKPPP